MSSPGLYSSSSLSRERPHSMPVFTVRTSSFRCFSVVTDPERGNKCMKKKKYYNSMYLTQLTGIGLPSQRMFLPRISLNFIFLSSWPFWTLQPATGSFFFPTVTSNMARTEASPEAWGRKHNVQRQERQPTSFFHFHSTRLSLSQCLVSRPSWNLHLQNCDVHFTEVFWLIGHAFSYQCCL